MRHTLKGRATLFDPSTRVLYSGEMEYYFNESETPFVEVVISGQTPADNELLTFTEPAQMEAVKAIMLAVMNAHDIGSVDANGDEAA